MRVRIKSASELFRSFVDENLTTRGNICRTLSGSQSEGLNPCHHQKNAAESIIPAANTTLARAKFGKARGERGVHKYQFPRLVRHATYPPFRELRASDKHLRLQ